MPSNGGAQSTAGVKSESDFYWTLRFAMLNSHEYRHMIYRRTLQPADPSLFRVSANGGINLVVTDIKAARELYKADKKRALEAGADEKGDQVGTGSGNQDSAQQLETANLKSDTGTGDQESEAQTGPGDAITTEAASQTTATAVKGNKAGDGDVSATSGSLNRPESRHLLYLPSEVYRTYLVTRSALCWAFSNHCTF